MSRRGGGIIAGAVIALVAAAVPAQAAPPPAANFGLSHRVCGAVSAGFARCHSDVVDRANGTPNAGTAPIGLAPATIQTVYNFPTSPTAGAGKTIAIVDAYDDPTAEADLATFSNQYGLPACTTANLCFTKVNQTGGTTYPLVNSGWALEISLDIQWAHAIAPGAKILLVEATSNSFTNLFAAEDYAKAHAQYVSNSWGGTEFSGETTYDSHLAQPGVSFFVSSGDNGTPAEYPSSSPNVVSVGGTTLHFTSGVFTSETGWSSGGGGCSSQETATTSQSGFAQYPQVSCNGKRATPDVALDADPASGVSVYDSTKTQGQSGWFKVGGTSASTPMWAARSAALGAVVNSAYVYGSNITYRDITSGNNGASCLIGYDLCSGRGSWTDQAVTYPLVSSPDASYAGHVPAGALDGNTVTWWQPVAASSSGDTRTLVIDRGPGAPSFLSVRNQWYSLGYQAIDYTIETSPDGSTWTNAATVTGNTSADRTDLVSQSDRYVRLVVSNWSNKLAATPDAQLALLELSFSNTVPYPLASSPDASFGGHVPAGALDGNTGTWWQPVAAASSGDTRTLVIDRGPGAPSFLSVRNQWYSLGYQAVDYTIETSPDGSTWTNAATVTGNTSADRTDLVSQSDRYVRLVVTNWSNKLAATPDAQLALLELSFSNTVPYPLVSSPDASYSGHVPADAMDGFGATWWQPVAATSVGDTRTLVIDRGPGAPSFLGVHTEWYAIGYQAIDYTIDTSPDGSTWTNAATVFGSTKQSPTDPVTQSDRYVRLVVTNWSNKLAPTPDAQLALKELVFTNALMYPQESSPEASYSGHTPALAFDGNLSTWWQPVAAGSPGDTRTWVIDRGAGWASFSAVRMQWYSVGYQAIDYTIETSPDGSTWTNAATVTGNTSADRTDVVSQANRYVRVVVSNWSNKLAPTPDAQLALLEITFS